MTADLMHFWLGQRQTKRTRDPLRSLETSNLRICRKLMVTTEWSMVGHADRQEIILPPLSDGPFWTALIGSPEFEEISAEDLVELTRPGFCGVRSDVEERVRTRLSKFVEIVARPRLQKELNRERREDLRQTTTILLFEALKLPDKDDFQALTESFANRVVLLVYRAEALLRRKQDGASYAALDDRSTGESEALSRLDRIPRLQNREVLDAGASAATLSDRWRANSDIFYAFLLREFLLLLPNDNMREAAKRKITGVPRTEQDPSGKMADGKRVRGRAQRCSWADAGKPYGIKGPALQYQVEKVLRELNIERRKRDRNNFVRKGGKGKPPGGDE